MKKKKGLIRTASAISILSLCATAVIIWGISIFLANYAEITNYEDNLGSRTIPVFSGIALFVYIAIMTFWAMDIRCDKKENKKSIEWVEYIKQATIWLLVIVFTTFLLTLFIVNFFKAMLWFFLLGVCFLGIFFIYQKLIKKE